MIVGVTNGRKILMTKYANREYKRYALIAGFTEIGETAEETVAREVKEEVGLSVKISVITRVSLGDLTAIFFLAIFVNWMMREMR